MIDGVIIHTSRTNVNRVYAEILFCHLRQLCDACGKLLISRNNVGHLMVVELLIRNKIEVAGAGQAEDNGLLLPCFLALKRFIDGSADGVAGFRRRENALGAGKILRRLESDRRGTVGTE